MLDDPEKVGGAEAVHRVGAAQCLGPAKRLEDVRERGLAGGVFAVFGHELLVEPGFLGHLPDDLFVVVGDVQLLGHGAADTAAAAADTAAAAAEFAADGEDVFIHYGRSFRVSIFRV